MESDTPVPAAGGRPRPALLVALAAAVMLLVFWWTTGKSAAPAPSPSKPRVADKQNVAPATEKDLTVRLDALKQPRPAADAGNRNPFRFYSPPPPAPSPVRPVPPLPEVAAAPVPTGPPPPAPIPLKYIGLIEQGPGKPKIAAFSDCRITMRAHEGEIVAGQYRLVRIGVESAVLEYLDGRGRTTIRMSGQECVGK
jgi:hypothetical protein